ncbi:MAG: thioredoxin family protein [Endomicrobiales bacterium]|nr:thioredoxin family protein [Endomicrobiales bacterium]
MKIKLVVAMLLFILSSAGFCKDKLKNSTQVTFVELGSINCMPCKMMQPVMADIEKEYGDSVKVIFYDVWSQAGKPYAAEYKIQAIPTQVFLDKNGSEFFRHLGFFPKEEIAKVLYSQGIKKIRTGNKNSSKNSASETNMQSGEICK